jgi:hypothetical protein
MREATVKKKQPELQTTLSDDVIKAQLAFDPPITSVTPDLMRRAAISILELAQVLDTQEGRNSIRFVVKPNVKINIKKDE